MPTAGKFSAISKGTVTGQEHWGTFTWLIWNTHLPLLFIFTITLTHFGMTAFKQCLKSCQFSENPFFCISGAQYLMSQTPTIICIRPLSLDNCSRYLPEAKI